VNTPDMAPLVRLDGIGLEVTAPVPTRILHPVTLSIQNRTSVAVVGPSGAGKTTLASIIGVLQPSSEGEYWFDGTNVSKLNTRRRADFRRDHIGYVFQNANLVDERNAWQNVALGLTDPTIDLREVEQRAKTALDGVGLSSVAERTAGLLSGGERQRVALARAIVKQPDLVIADEPTGSLDQATGQAVLDLLFGIGATLLMVTHDIKAARRANQTVSIIDGRLT